jgi:hypothetical protein
MIVAAPVILAELEAALRPGPPLTAITALIIVDVGAGVVVVRVAPIAPVGLLAGGFLV